MRSVTLSLLFVAALSWANGETRSIMFPSGASMPSDPSAPPGSMAFVMATGQGEDDAAPRSGDAAGYGEERRSTRPPREASYEERSSNDENAPDTGESKMEPARLVYLSGDSYVKGGDADEWSAADLNLPLFQGDSLWAEADGRMELELSGGIVVRLAQNARLDLVSLHSSVLLRANSGAVFVKVPAIVEERVVVEAPGASIELQGGSYVRLDVDDEGYTRYTVYAGEAEVAQPDGRTVVPAMSRVYVEPGSLPSDREDVDEESYDDFDAWAKERDRTRPTLTEYGSSRGMDRYVPGSGDLDRSGTWVQIENRGYYQPRVSRSWRPYSNGYWSYAPRYGYVWVSHDPFGYTTHHYGRWTWMSSHGWLWYPSYVWSPHTCYFASYGSNVYWAPLDPWGRPVNLGRSDYRFGSGFQVDFRAWSSMPSSAFVAGSREISVVHRGMWSGAIRMDVVASPHRVWTSKLRGRTPFGVTARGLPIQKRMVQVESQRMKVPKPGHRLGPSHGAGKSPAARVKMHGNPKPFRVTVPGSPRVVKGPPSLAPVERVKPPKPGEDPVRLPHLGKGKGKPSAHQPAPALPRAVERGPAPRVHDKGGKGGARPVADKEKAHPVADKEKAHPVAGKEKARPVAGKEKTHPAAGREKARPVAGKEQARPAAGKEKAHPVAGKEKARPVAGKEKTRHVAGTEKVEPRGKVATATGTGAGKDVPAPKAGGKAADKKKQPKETSEEAEAADGKSGKGGKGEK